MVVLVLEAVAVVVVVVVAVVVVARSSSKSKRKGRDRAKLIETAVDKTRSCNADRTHCSTTAVSAVYLQPHREC